VNQAEASPDHGLCIQQDVELLPAGQSLAVLGAGNGRKPGVFKHDFYAE